MIFWYTERFDMTAIFLDISALDQEHRAIGHVVSEKALFSSIFPKEICYLKNGLTINIETFHGCFMKARGIYK